LKGGQIAVAQRVYDVYGLDLDGTVFLGDELLCGDRPGPHRPPAAAGDLV
jgi:hypothetical protein